MNLDFALILVILTFLTGLIWLLDTLFLRQRRRDRTVQLSNQPLNEPVAVEYSRSLFPVLLVVLLFRSFLFEPFKIPSGSMIPTLLIGDFIVVNKFAYGLRLPVLNRKFVSFGDPQRGDVAVFRFPKNPSDDYIKRVIGLPGDRITYKDKTLFINGQQMGQVKNGIFQGTGANSGMNGIAILHEDLETVAHDILLKQSRYNVPGEFSVPENHYFVMGDNRDHSSDSRIWGFVPEENLVGRAFLVWMNWDFAGKRFNFERVGKKII